MSFPKKYAFRRWTYHCRMLAQCSYAVRTTTLMTRFSTWIIARKNRARHRVAAEQSAREMGERARKSWSFQVWKVALEEGRRNALLAEERRQTWQEVNTWLASTTQRGAFVQHLEFSEEVSL